VGKLDIATRVVATAYVEPWSERSYLPFSLNNKTCAPWSLLVMHTTVVFFTVGRETYKSDHLGASWPPREEDHRFVPGQADHPQLVYVHKKLISEQQKYICYVYRCMSQQQKYICSVDRCLMSLLVLSEVMRWLQDPSL